MYYIINIMTKQYSKAIFIHRRDLRIYDNLGILCANTLAESLIPIFIFDPMQVSNKNKFKSNNAIQFMVESLEDLSAQYKDKGGKLHLLYGNTNNVLKEVFDLLKPDLVVFCADYTPFARKRDNNICKLCKQMKIDVRIIEDSMLVPIKNTPKTSNDTPYKVFTPYFNAAKKISIDKPQNITKLSFANVKHKLPYIDNMSSLYTKNTTINVHGGRTNGLKILKNIKKFSSYNKTRNIPSKDTTHLSAYNKFGCISIREEYYAFVNTLGKNNELIKQLYWRDFYMMIAYFHPHILGKLGTNRNFKENYSKVPWITSKNATKQQKEYLKLWQQGKTGFPIVDAGMRQLNTTGFMHNRLRMIVASFLTKNLFWHWEEGEIYFANNLVDYSPMQNHGGWTWTAGSGVDSQPYFRVFNPWSQSQKYDPNAEYIKKWIPELKNVPAKDIHKWNENYNNYKNVKYPEPIVDYSKTREQAIAKFKKALN